MSGPERLASRPASRPADRFEAAAASPQPNGGAGEGVTSDLFQVVALAPTAAVSYRLQQLRNDHLSARDLAVLRTLAALRVMTTGQIARVHFAANTPASRDRRARDVLQRLGHHGLVARLDRHVGGPDAGSTSHAYHLTTDGYKVAGARAARTEGFVHTRAHTLAVTELAVTLYEADRAGTLGLRRFETEPVCWRTYTHNGTRRHVRPDAFVITAAGHGERLTFVELDQGTQTTATVRRKALNYHAYAMTGDEQDRWGVFPRLAVLTPTAARRDALADALATVPDAAALLTVARQADALDALTPTTHPDHEGDQP
jgi:hypothetical protein